MIVMTMMRIMKVILKLRLTAPVLRDCQMKLRNYSLKQVMFLTIKKRTKMLNLPNKKRQMPSNQLKHKLNHKNLKMLLRNQFYKLKLIN